MAEISPGAYTVQEIFRLADFDVSEAGADYLDGQPDMRRLTVGGLGFDSLESPIRVPATADVVEVTLDGEVVKSLSVALSKEHLAERAYSFETAADADDPKSKSSTPRQSKDSE